MLVLVKCKNYTKKNMLKYRLTNSTGVFFLWINTKNHYQQKLNYGFRQVLVSRIKLQSNENPLM